MDSTCHECGEPQTVWMAARCSNPSKTVTCGEVFCFQCLSQKYPHMYGSIFKGLWWLCPACLGMCKCEICSDPVKRAEYLRNAKKKLSQKPKPVTVEDNKPKLRSAYNKTPVRPPPPPIETSPVFVDEPENGWICSRCSILNTLDDIECLACGGHRKRNTRKRSAPEPLHEDKFQAFKETRRATENNNEEKATPVKGRVSALRQLVKRPWEDGWETGRKLALDLVEEARQQALRQGSPVDQVRQLPTKYQLANNRNTHVRKWFDREPTLAKKFLRAAGLTCSKSNGTFIRDGIRSLKEMPDLIRKADTTRFVSESGSNESGEDEDGAAASDTTSPVDISPVPSPVGYQPKLKVYYHQQSATPPPEDSPMVDAPFVFKVPISDLRSLEELHTRLNDLLQEMGTQTSEKKLILRVSYSNPQRASDECRSIDDLSRCALLHVHAQ